MKPCPYFYLFILALLSSGSMMAQITIPWSSSKFVDFGNGNSIIGPPVPATKTGFTYTTDTCPLPGFYTIKKNCYCNQAYAGLDAGHWYRGPFQIQPDSGYLMILSQGPSAFPKIVFQDTVRNLCGNRDYLFCAGIKELSQSACIYPNLTFSVETTTGVVIQSFQSGDIGGKVDNYSWYPGYYNSRTKPPGFAFYGGDFTLPAGINDIVLKIITNPANANSNCRYMFGLDNILLTPAGPDTKITTPGNPDGFIVGACFQGNVPAIINGAIGNSYTKLGSFNKIPSSYTNPAVQWQMSIDEGFTWSNVPGETNLQLSHVFNTPDTFIVRMVSAEASDIGNTNCVVPSNVIIVRVDGPPSNIGISSNSPVCTDGDLIFKLEGGATYSITGPNGYSDNIPFPHIFNPPLKDSGWYFTEVSTFGGCKAKDSTYVEIIGPDIRVSDNAAVCYGKSVPLFASGGNKYSWTPVTGLSNPNIANPIAGPMKTTKYIVKVTDTLGCSGFGKVIISLRDSLLQSIIEGPSVLCPKDIALFTDKSRGAIVRWNWDFGNGQTSILQNPAELQFAYSSRTKDNIVQLVVTDTAACADTSLFTVKLANNCFIAVPNAFSPNKDGNNDYLYPLNAYKATNLVFRIYNRKGQLVFETRDWTNKWDGTIHGEPQPPGAYVWTLDYTDDKKKSVSLKGTSVLVR